MALFEKYKCLKQIKTYENEEIQEQLDSNLDKIKSRSNHIHTLLNDKEQLLKEKELSMLVKQKLKLYEKG